MDLEKMIEVGQLFQRYRNLLTDKQKEIVSLYYEEDYSLGEISENLNVSRQGVYDTLKRSEKTMRDYEKKLHLVSKLQKQEEAVKLVKNRLKSLKDSIKEDTDICDLIPKLDEIEDICRGIIE